MEDRRIQWEAHSIQKARTEVKEETGNGKNGKGGEKDCSCDKEKHCHAKYSWGNI